MKTLIISSEQKLKEIECSTLNDLYKLCGYKVDKNYICIDTLEKGEYTIEFWGKISKKTYNFNNIKLSGKCAIVAKKQEVGYIDIDTEQFNSIINIKKNLDNIDIDIDGNDNDNNEDNDDNDDNDDNEVNDDNEDNEDNEDNDENEDNEDNDENEDNEDIEDNEDNQENDDNDEDDDNDRISGNQNKCFYNKNYKSKDKNNDTTLDKLFNDKNKISINEIICNQLEHETYIYSSDEDS